MHSVPPPRVFLFLDQPVDAPADRPWALVWAEGADAWTYTRAEPGVFYTSKYAARHAGLMKFQEYPHELKPLRCKAPDTPTQKEPPVSTNHTQTFVVVLRRTAAQPIQPQTLARELAAFLHAGSGTLLPAEISGVTVMMSSNDAAPGEHCVLTRADFL
jgi:hypothetical protein